MIHHELKQAVHSYVLTQDRLILSDWIEEYLSSKLADKIRNLPEECPEPTLPDLLPEELWYKDNWENAKIAKFEKQGGCWCPHNTPGNDWEYRGGLPRMYCKDGLSTYRCPVCTKVFFQWENWPLSLYHRVAMSIYGYIFKPGTALVEDTLFGAWPIETNLDPPWIVTNGINEWTGRIGVRKSGSTEVQWFTISPRKSSNAMATS